MFVNNSVVLRYFVCVRTCLFVQYFVVVVIIATIYSMIITEREELKSCSIPTSLAYTDIELTRAKFDSLNLLVTEHKENNIFFRLFVWMYVYIKSRLPNGSN